MEIKCCVRKHISPIPLTQRDPALRNLHCTLHFISTLQYFTCMSSPLTLSLEVLNSCHVHSAAILRIIQGISFLVHVAFSFLNIHLTAYSNIKAAL